MLKKILWTLAAAVLLPMIWYLADLPDTSRLRKENPTTSAIRTYREAQMRRTGRKPHSLMIWRPLIEISPDLAHAVVLSEDDTFFQHHGFDFAQTRRALETNWQRKRFAFGGSTLTQQLARTLYLSTHKNLLRKLKEALITRRLEKTLPKKRILELYLNVVEWGPQVYGAEAASRYFFHKPAADLTPDEAISLAAILPSPRRWNPLSERSFMVRRRAILHDRMVRAHYLPAAVSSGTLALPLLEYGGPSVGTEMPGTESDMDADDESKD